MPQSNDVIASIRTKSILHDNIGGSVSMGAPISPLTPFTAQTAWSTKNTAAVDISAMAENTCKKMNTLPTVGTRPLKKSKL